MGRTALKNNFKRKLRRLGYSKAGSFWKKPDGSALSVEEYDSLKKEFFDRVNALKECKKKRLEPKEPEEPKTPKIKKEKTAIQKILNKKETYSLKKEPKSEKNKQKTFAKKNKIDWRDKKTQFLYKRGFKFVDGNWTKGGIVFSQKEVEEIFNKRKIRKESICIVSKNGAIKKSLCIQDYLPSKLMGHSIPDSVWSHFDHFLNVESSRYFKTYPIFKKSGLALDDMKNFSRIVLWSNYSFWIKSEDEMKIRYPKMIPTVSSINKINSGMLKRALFHYFCGLLKTRLEARQKHNNIGELDSDLVNVESKEEQDEKLFDKIFSLDDQVYGGSVFFEKDENRLLRKEFVERFSKDFNRMTLEDKKRELTRIVQDCDSDVLDLIKEVIDRGYMI